jgi:hypothetical protein
MNSYGNDCFADKGQFLMLTASAQTGHIFNESSLLACASSDNIYAYADAIYLDSLSAQIESLNSTRCSVQTFGAAVGATGPSASFSALYLTVVEDRGCSMLIIDESPEKPSVRDSNFILSTILSIEGFTAAVLTAGSDSSGTARAMSVTHCIFRSNAPSDRAMQIAVGDCAENFVVNDCVFSDSLPSSFDATGTRNTQTETATHPLQANDVSLCFVSPCPTRSHSLPRSATVSHTPTATRSPPPTSSPDFANSSPGGDSFVVIASIEFAPSAQFNFRSIVFVTSLIPATAGFPVSHIFHESTCLPSIVSIASSADVSPQFSISDIFHESVRLTSIVFIASSTGCTAKASLSDVFCESRPVRSLVFVASAAVSTARLSLSDVLYESMPVRSIFFIASSASVTDGLSASDAFLESMVLRSVIFIETSAFSSALFAMSGAVISVTDGGSNNVSGGVTIGATFGIAAGAIALIGSAVFAFLRKQIPTEYTYNTTDEIEIPTDPEASFMMTEPVSFGTYENINTSDNEVSSVPE